MGPQTPTNITGGHHPVTTVSHGFDRPMSMALVSQLDGDDPGLIRTWMTWEENIRGYHYKL